MFTITNVNVSVGRDGPLRGPIYSDNDLKEEITVKTTYFNSCTLSLKLEREKSENK